MSSASLKKQTSYSEFRKKNSLSKGNLHKSMVDIQNSISLIADEKTQQLSSLQQQLQNIVRNRSLSNKPSAKTVPQTYMTNSMTKSVQSQSILHIKPRRNSLSDLNPHQIMPKSARSTNFIGLSQTFDVIEQTQMHNQEDNGFIEAKQQVKNNQKTAKNKFQKASMQKKKNICINNLISTQKVQTKVSLQDLEQMQKRLQSVKKIKKAQIRQVKQKRIKKQQVITKPMPKVQKRLVKTASQTNFLQQMKNRAFESQKQTPKIIPKKKILPNTEPFISSTKSIISKKSTQNQATSLGMIPTKMVSAQEKQKLFQQFEKLKSKITNTDICVQNVQKIRNLMKGIQELIN